MADKARGHAATARTSSGQAALATRRAADPGARPLSLLAEMGHFAQSLADRPRLGSMLEELAGSLCPMLGLAGAGVLLLGDAEPLVVCTPVELAELEHVQLRSGTGPCVEAARSGTEVWVTDLAVTAQWGAYAELASYVGVRAVAGVSLGPPEHLVGAIDLYSTTPRRWSEEDMTVARAMAAIAGAHITALTSLEHQRTLAVQLQNALDSRVVLEQAKGVLAASAGIGMDEAFTRMRRHARRRSVTLASVADAVVKLGLRPDR